jgi:hypothetical protein
MADYVQYRKNGGEVTGISIQDVFQDTTYSGFLTDPSAPDGLDLSTPKINDSGTVRNATGPEIAAFPTYQAEDENLMQREQAKTLLNSHPMYKKLLKGLVTVLISEINLLRAQHGLTDRTLQQAVDAILSEIDTGAND